MVEVEGWGRLAPSCITPVAEGMVVQTDNERVNRSRRTILEMLNASVDISKSPSLLQQMERYEADPQRFPGAKKRQHQILVAIIVIMSVAMPVSLTSVSPPETEVLLLSFGRRMTYHRPYNDSFHESDITDFRMTRSANRISPTSE